MELVRFVRVYIDIPELCREMSACAISLRHLKFVKRKAEVRNINLL